MKLSGAFGFACVAGTCATFVALGAALGIGCSSSGGGGGGGGSSGGASDNCKSGAMCTLAPTQDGGPTMVTAAHNYALHKLYLGDTRRDGTPDANAWATYGYNLDNLVTTRTSTDVCTRAPGAASDIQVDGNGGIDNSFGENIVPIINSTAGDVGTSLNASINKGSFTLMTYVKGFDDTAGSTQTALGLSGALLSGADYTLLNAGPPAWNTTTHWPVAPELLKCGASCVKGTDDPIQQSKVQFPQAYVTNGTFVNGTPSDVTLSLGIGGQTLQVVAHSAVLTFQAGQTPGTITNGTIAGVVRTTELLSAVQGIAGHISHALCSGAAFSSIAMAINQASDIVLHDDGSISNNASETCNAISIGLGFDSTEIAIPTPNDIAGPSPPAPDPCADAGAE
jgi:hypothetical protein